MAETSDNTNERRQNLWAPWRMEYIDALDDAPDDCFLCRYREQPGRDEENLIVYRGRDVLVVMNRFPYSTGHMLIAPQAHVATLEELPPEALTELISAVRDCHTLLREVMHPDGANVGVNFGRCAGAGLPGHLHVHIVPRWDGDTNFMSVVGDVRVIPKSLAALHADLRAGARTLGLGEG